MTYSQAITPRRGRVGFYSLLKRWGQDYAGQSCHSLWDRPLPASDDKERGNLKPLPATKDVVAVALHQAREADRAPKVVAAGRGTVAEQILEIAFSQGIKVREDADLAQVLSAVDEDSEIPTEAFAAVAEILVYLYQVNGDHPPGADAEAPSGTLRELADTLAEKWRADKETSE